MALQTLGLASFKTMSEGERRARLEAFRNTPPNGEVSTLKSSINRLENRYEMSSETMRERFRKGNISETEEIGAWLMMLDAVERATK